MLKNKLFFLLRQKLKRNVFLGFQAIFWWVVSASVLIIPTAKEIYVKEGLLTKKVFLS